MSNAHKGSRLILKNQVIATDFSSFHADFNVDKSAIFNGNVIFPKQDISTMRLDGKFGGAVGIHQETTNLINNPLFNGTSGWTITAQKDTAFNHYYNIVDTPYGKGINVHFERLSGSGNAWPLIRNSATWLASGNITQSLMIKVNSAYGSRIEIRNSGISNDYGSGATGSSASFMTPYGAESVGKGWIRHEHSRSDWGNRQGSGGALFEMYSQSMTTAGQYVDFTFALPQVEQKPFATSFVDGSRASGQLYYDKEVINEKKSTLSMWFNIPYMHRNQEGNTGIQGNWFIPVIEYAPLSNRGNSATFAIAVRPNGNPNYGICQLGPKDSGDGTVIKEKTWYHLAVTFNDGTITTYLNGDKQFQTTGNSIANYDDTVLMIGGGYRGKPNILVSDAYIDNDIVQDEDEIKAWYVSEKPFYNPYDYRAFS